MALRLTVPTFQVYHSVALNIHAVPSSSGTSWTSLLPKHSSTPARQRLTEPCRHHSVLRLWVSDYSTLRANILIQHESFYNRLVSLTVSSRAHQCCGVGMSVRLLTADWFSLASVTPVQYNACVYWWVLRWLPCFHPCENCTTVNTSVQHCLETRLVISLCGIEKWNF